MFGTPLDFAACYGVSGYLLWMLCALVVKRIGDSIRDGESVMETIKKRLRNLESARGGELRRLDNLDRVIRQSDSIFNGLREKVDSVSSDLHKANNYLSAKVDNCLSGLREELNSVSSDLRKANNLSAKVDNRFDSAVEKIEVLGQAIGSLSEASLSRKDFEQYRRQMAAHLVDFDQKFESAAPVASIKALCRPEIVKLFDMVRIVPEDKWYYDGNAGRWTLDMSHVGQKFVGVQILYSYSSQSNIQASSLPGIVIKFSVKSGGVWAYTVRRFAERLLFSIYFPNKNDADNFNAVKDLVSEDQKPTKACDVNSSSLLGL